MDLRVGVDVGGTNTDAVVMVGDDVLGWAKTMTTEKVEEGIATSITLALKDAKVEGNQVKCVMVGTTHFTNALVQRKHLSKVGVVRLCGPSTVSVPPFIEFPSDIYNAVYGHAECLSGGFHFDCQLIDKEPQHDEVREFCKKLKEKGIWNVVVSGVFSVLNNSHEALVAGWIQEEMGNGVSVTLSSDLGHLGLLARENAAILNASLIPLAKTTLKSLQNAAFASSLSCPLWLTQNDGTLLSLAGALSFPVLCISSGPTNSMRGAYALSGVKNGVVVDIGGTTSDVGVLVDGFPREASTNVTIGGVPSNFRMPDVLCIGLGAGSYIHSADSIGPRSIGREQEKSICYGGKILTMMCLAVAAGNASPPGSKKPEEFAINPFDLVEKGLETARGMVERVIDMMKTSAEDIPVILVGGGSSILDTSKGLKGVSKVVVPNNSMVANAIGAAMCQVSGLVDIIVDLKEETRDEGVERAKRLVREKTEQNGANLATINLLDLEVMAISYVPNTVRIVVKAAGDMDLEKSIQHNEEKIVIEESILPFPSPSPSPSSSPTFNADPSSPAPTQPYVNPKTKLWEVSLFDIDCLAIGNGLLGCGGGGKVNSIVVKNSLKKGKKVSIAHPTFFKKGEGRKGGTVLPVGTMGAPTMSLELQSSASIKCSLRDKAIVLQKERGEEGGEVVGVMALEIGGENGFAPLEVGAESDGEMVVCDCDGMGRAFPELQMYMPFAHGTSISPFLMISQKGDVAVITAEGVKELEDKARLTCVNFGMLAPCVLPPLTYDEIKTTCVPHSFSMSWRIGRAVLQGRETKTDVFSSLQASLSPPPQKLISGKIVHIDRDSSDGFVRGKAKIKEIVPEKESSVKSGRLVVLEFQNEFLAAREDSSSSSSSSLLACCPDLICLMDTTTGAPIYNEEIRYGQRVTCFTLPASSRTTSPEGLEVVSPQCFNIDASYTPSNPPQWISFCPAFE